MNNKRREFEDFVGPRYTASFTRAVGGEYADQRIEQMFQVWKEALKACKKAWHRGYWTGIIIMAALAPLARNIYIWIHSL